MTALYVILAVVLVFNILCNIYVLYDMKKEGWVTWSYYVYESQDTKIGRIFMKIYFWIPTLFC